MNTSASSGKRTRHFKSSSNGVLSVVHHIKATGGLPEGVLSNRTLTRVLKFLKIEGIITKLGYGTYVVNEGVWQKFLEKQQHAKSSQDGHPQTPKLASCSTGNIRGHGFMFVLRLPHIQNWDARQKVLESKGIKPKIIKQGQSFVFRGHKTWLTKKTIVIFAPEGKDYFASKAAEARKLAVYDMKQLTLGLENLLGINARIGGKHHYRFRKQHYADVNNAFAKNYDKRVLRVANWKGEWLLIDWSTGVPELETVDADDAVEDMDDLVVRDFNELKETQLTRKQILSMLGQVVKNQAQYSEDQAYYAENLKSHVSAIQTLDSSVKKFTSVVDASSFQKGHERRKENHPLKHASSDSASLGPGFQKTLDSFGGVAK